MRAVVQRVSEASVQVDGAEVARIGRGLLVLAGLAQTDTEADRAWMSRKIVDLRIFDDADGKLNLSLNEVSGEILLVSQFTLYGDCRKGRRPSYIEAAPPHQAAPLYRRFVEIVREIVPHAQSGQFQAMMQVSLVNCGPVTVILESRKT
jgi:D-tyrosyl-tRNA(Tyr) deacylase